MSQKDKAIKTPPARNWFFSAAAVVLVLAFLLTAWMPGGILSNEKISWVQNYAPIADSLYLSTVVAAIPILVIFVMLGVFRVPAYISTVVGLVSTLATAILIWQMPVGLAFNSALMGMLMAVFPIVWTLASAVWIFNMMVASGKFEVVKASLGYVSKDRRIQTLLIGFGFTTLLESLAAFGAPIAIITAMLLGFGFPPLTAATVALLADTTPSVWGTQGMPVEVLSSVTDLNIVELSAMAGMQAPVLAAFFPLALVVIVAGWKGAKGIWPAAVAVGVTYAVVGICTSKTGPHIVGISAAMASIITLLAILRFWKPKNIWLFPGEDEANGEVSAGDRLPFNTIVRAWSPYILLLIVIGLVNATPLKAMLASISTITIQWPGLHEVVMKLPPVAAEVEPYAAVYSQPLLVVGGTLVFFTGIISSFILGLKPKESIGIFLNTLKNLFFPGLTIVSVLGIAYVMNYSSMTYTIGLTFAATGFLFPVAVTFMGMLGCTLAGSVAASNALFGNLSVVSATQLGISPVFAAGTLTSGGAMGKAIAFQDLVIASGALNRPGIEGELLRRVLGISLLFTLLLGLIAMAQMFLF
ncbi:L-lactate permease [Desulfofalx alkaliphila]|uniref:L-lactate permease n=1 Tax=Desulfofalx alkaliphila TaxID=105483 RepID=UPI00068B719F|nr:lactate permease LctP family transporter [Desulfofalx alkaliphila]